MQTTFSQRFNGLDHLRAIAILLVLMYHYRAFIHPDWIDTYGRFGWTGVDLFFVLSGFLISNQLFQEIKNRGNFSLKSFFIKRFFRIIPPYFFTLMLYFCFPFFRERKSLSSLWKFLSFTQNYGLDVINKGTFSHAWSLCIEEQFYLILPFSLLLLIKSKTLKYLKFIIFVIILFSILARYFSWHEYVFPNINSNEFWKIWYMKIYYPTHTRLDGLAIGVLIGYLFQYSSKFRKLTDENGNLFLLSGLAFLGFSLWVCNDQSSEFASIFGFTFVAISYGFIVISAISKSSFISKSKNYFTTQLANLSFTIYLSHKGIIHIIQSLIEFYKIPISENLLLITCLIGCILGGLFYRYFIEKPSLKLRNRISINQSS